MENPGGKPQIYHLVFPLNPLRKGSWLVQLRASSSPVFWAQDARESSPRKTFEQVEEIRAAASGSGFRGHHSWISLDDAGPYRYHHGTCGTCENRSPLGWLQGLTCRILHQEKRTLGLRRGQDGSGWIRMARYFEIGLGNSDKHWWNRPATYSKNAFRTRNYSSTWILWHSPRIVSGWSPTKPAQALMRYVGSPRGFLVVSSPKDLQKLQVITPRSVEFAKLMWSIFLILSPSSETSLMHILSLSLYG